LSKGLYFASIIDNSGQMAASGKIVLEK